MPTFCARGVNHSEVKDFTHDQLQDLVGTISLRKEPRELLDRAHREKWCDCLWEVEDVGRWKPRYDTSNHTKIFCTIADRESYILCLHQLQQ